MVRSRAVYASLWNMITTEVVGNPLGYDRPAHLSKHYKILISDLVLGGIKNHCHGYCVKLNTINHDILRAFRQ